MKYILPIAVLIIFSGCKKEGVSHLREYNKSYQAWLAFKDSSNNSYRYMVSQVSWTGYGTETIITVRNGVPVERSYTARMRRRYNGTGVADSLVVQWHEDAAQLSAHDQGAPALTLDEIYKEATDNWLRSRDDAETFFEANNNGKISTCGYVPKNCADDCFIGIHIGFIEGL